jgi:internalin A
MFALAAAILAAVPLNTPQFIRTEPKPIDPEIVKAWEAAGAMYGHIRTTDELGFYFEVESPKHGECPAFIVQGNLKLSELSAPDVPFGLICSKIPDASLKGLSSFQQLRCLDLSDTKVTDAGLKELAPHKQLQSLFLRYTRVVDAGVKELAALKQLRTLNLYEIDVTDVGLKELAALKQLQFLPSTG